MTRNKKLVKLMALAVAASTVATSVPAYAAFDATYYAQQNPDVVAAIGTKPADLETHYNVFGKKEGRAGSADEAGSALRQLFDAEFYAKMNPDVVAVLGNDANALFNHFLQFGIKEGRRINPYFDVNAYKKAYPDLVAAFGDDIAAYYNHFANHGISEHRTLGGFPAEKIVPGGVVAYSGGESSSSSSGSGGSSSKPAPKPADVTPTPDPTPAPAPDKEKDPEPQPTPEVTAPTLEDVTVAATGTVNLKIKNAPDGYKATEWTSSDTTIATVTALADSDGVIYGEVTAIAGTAGKSVTITAKLVKDNDVIPVTCTVNIVSASIEVEPTELVVAVDTRETILSTPIGAAGAVRWSTSNPSIAEVDTSGVVKGVGAGVATITATITDAAGKEYTATCKVTVTTPSIKLKEHSISLEEGDPTYQLEYTTIPSSDSADCGTVTFGSTDTKMNDVINLNPTTGVITVVAPGSTSVYANYNVGGKDYKDTCVVTVSKLTPSIKLSKTSLEMSTGTASLAVESTKPVADGATKKVTWTTSDSNVVSLSDGDETGVTLNALKAGNATITATLTKDSQVLASATCQVEVLPSITVTLNDPSVVAGGTTLATVGGISAGQTIRWESSDPSIATVTDNGANATVTGIKAGEANIIAKFTADDGKEYSAFSPITVDAVIAASISTPASLTMSPGSTNNTYKLTITKANNGSGTITVTDTSAGLDPVTFSPTTAGNSTEVTFTITTKSAITEDQSFTVNCDGVSETVNITINNE